MHRIRTLAMIGVCALTAIIAASVPAAAGPIVDPNTLTPVPPPRAVCRADGSWTICHTVFLEEFANELPSNCRAAPSTKPDTIPAPVSAGTSTSSS
jgi:hypothetical protein